MKPIADWHTHTIYSKNNHGKGSIEENVQAAIKMGFKEIAITDHGPGHFLYGIEDGKIQEMREEIDRLKLIYPEINILLGIEANIISYNGDLDVDEKFLSYLDILVAGFHYGVWMKGIKSIFLFFILNPISKIFPPLRNFMKRKNTTALIKAVEKYDIDFLSHPGSKATIDAFNLAEACEKNNVFLEINGYHENLSIEDIIMAKDTGVEFIINSDAHSPSRVGDFKKAIKRAKAANLDKSKIKNIE